MSHNQQSILRLLEPHPVSGEVELDEGEIDNVRYKRLDVETLHARVDFGSIGLRVIYLWCYSGKEEQGVAADTEEQVDRWRLAELVAIEEDEKIIEENETAWAESVAGADETFGRMKDGGDQTLAGVINNNSAKTAITAKNGHDNDNNDEEDDDDAYWAAYDQTPGPTPTRTSPPPLGGPSAGSRTRSNTAIYTSTSNGRNSGPNPNLNTKPYNTNSANGNSKSSTSSVSKRGSYTASLANSRNISASELAYFARYESEVQPAMDGHDPDEERGVPNQSNTTKTETSRTRRLIDGAPYSSNANASDNNGTTMAQNQNPNLNPDLVHPQPQPHNTYHSPPTSANTITTGITTMNNPRAADLASNLECYASLASHQIRAETAVRQHIATNVKSMYRLAGSVGIGREEFERLVMTEVELLGVGEEEED